MSVFLDLAAVQYRLWQGLMGVVKEVAYTVKDRGKAER